MKKSLVINVSAALLTGAVVAAIVNAQTVPSSGPATGTAPATGRGGRGARGGGRGAAVPFADPNANLSNLALVAKASASFTSGDTTINAVNDGVVQPGRTPPGQNYGNWPRVGTQWVEYTWSQPISTNKIDVLYWSDGGGVLLPSASRLKYWNGTSYVEVPNAKGLGVEASFNTTAFDEITTTRIRLEMDSTGGNQIATGINEFRVYDSGKSPAFPPSVKAGMDRAVVQKGKTYLNGNVKALKPADTTIWAKASGPGTVAFENANALATTATFSDPGDYVLQLTSKIGTLAGTDTLHVRVVPGSTGARLEPVQTSVYKIDSPLWSPRIKTQITAWIPHVIDFLEHPEKHSQGQGGLDNFVEAAKKLRGEPAGRHLGLVFSNAYVHNAVEAMCVALMVDPQGDAAMIKAQNDMRATLDRWIPIILAAQESDGYIQTAFTLSTRQHWSPATRADHEGYTMGYFLESAISHYNMTKGADLRLYNAAKKCADCWVANIGPGKKVWYDGHQEMENALVRFSRLVEQVDGPGKGKAYVDLAKFLLDSRANGSEYDQSHLPVIRQYEAVGHAVRAAYTYTGMASVAAEFHDFDYESATLSLWDNIINKKIYITGGIGSGETSEGFGPDYSLSNPNAYAESCANCGELFFQYNMLLNYHDAKYVNAMEDTLYNAILGDNNLAGTLFQYTNPLVNGNRTAWHDCPCCVANIPRTLLQLPTWTYSISSDSIYVNLFVGSTMSIPKFAPTPVEMVQKTNYPWDGKVAITVNPKEAKTFSLRIRVPDRQVGTLYTTTPRIEPSQGLFLSINGVSTPGQTPVGVVPYVPPIEKGYVVITREWKPGDKVEFEFPMTPQRVKADEHLAADRGRVALRYGPLIYNVETVDGNNMAAVLPAASQLSTEWRPELLDGVVVIRGKYADGTDLTAIPNYTRNNRQQSGGAGRGRGGGGAFSQVWIADQ